MLKYQKLIPGQLPDLSWYDQLELPEGKSYRVTQRICLPIDEVINTNSSNQEVNEVRSIGTDNVNKELIKNNILVNGVLVSVQPPYVYEKKLFDGFTRFESYLELGVTHVIFNDLELKKGFTERDMRDEIGLGANNHPPSKSATINDFKKRLSGHIDHFKVEHDLLPSTGYCIDWVNDIPHSFAPKQVVDIVDECLKKHRCSASVVAMDSNKANQWSAKYCPDDLKIIPLNVSAQKGGGVKGTYFDRAFITAFYQAGDLSFLGYTQGIEAEELDHYRLKAQERIDAANKAFEEAFQRRLDEGASFKMFRLEGFVPQIIGEETELVKVKSDDL
tara:strand:- start:981 stop:1976 length:996 start_codon:yes stop_codon:yes gene_type:complete